MPSTDELVEENRRLRRSMRDLVALSTLPAVWIGLPPSGIARGLTDVLLNTLSLELVYVRIESANSQSTEVVRISKADNIPVEQVRALLAQALVSDGTSPPVPLPNFLGGGTLHLAVTRFGIGKEHGVLVTGSRNPDYPTERDRLLLSVGANHTAIVLQRRHAEDLTHEQQERLAVTLASIGDAVLTTDTEGQVTYLNPVAEALTGWNLADAMGQPLTRILRIVNQDTYALVENPVSEVLRLGQTMELANHTLLISKSGIERPIADSAAPIRGKGGQIIGCVLVFRDISEKQRAEAEVRQAGEQARTILESITDGFLAVDHEWRFTYVNKQAERLLSRKKHELLGNVMWAEYPGLLGTDFERVYRQARDGIAGTVTSYFADHDRWYEVHAYPATNGIAVYFRNATEQRNVMDRLKEAEEQFRTMADNLPQLSWMAGPDGDVFWFNRRWYEYTGTTFEQVKGKGWHSLVGPEDVPRALDSFARSIKSGEPWEDTFALRRHDGALRWHLSRAMPIRNIDGVVTRWFGSNTDITDQRQMAADLSEADRRKNEFIAMLAHELRNPLAPIRTGLEVLKLAGLGGKATQLARDMMDRQLDQMVRLVDDLMDVSRISSGKIELRKELVLLSNVVTSAIETSRPLILRMGHELEVSIPDHAIVVTADLTRLAQVFMNLLNNAAKYSDPGSRIALIAKVEGGEVVVTVKDSGIGIAEHNLKAVFEMFAQVDRSLEKSQGGLGIGLTLVKRLVELHGGKVEARSEGPGRGSEFIVRLPVVVDASMAEAEILKAELAEGSSLRVLVVDDNEDGADMLSTMLGYMGNDIRVAHDGEEAVTKAAEFQPHVVLLDIGLPKLNGYDACRRIRALPGGDKLLVIAQTGWGQPEDRRRTREAGFDHHLVKPLEAEVLRKIISAHRPGGSQKL